MFTTLLVPNFYLQAALRHAPELRGKPVALIDDRATKAMIIELNEAAEAARVRCGMAPSQGLARCMQLIVRTRDRLQERLLAEIVLQSAFTLSPDVETTAAGMWTIQFTDTRRIEENVARVIETLSGIGISARAGIAPTPDASLLAAHAARPVLMIDDAKSFLASLPLEVLATV
jgi:nucleotidyltransferase/DNA polymerase involved in DNA repair